MTDETKAPTAEEFAALQSQLAEATKGIDSLKAKNDELLGEKKAAAAKAKEAEEARQRAADEAAAKAGDVDALTKSWQDKLNKREAELAEAIKARDAQLQDLTVNATAQRLASELAVPGSADVLLPHIRQRLSFQDGQMFVLDGEGKPSAATVDDLKKEIFGDKRFAPVIAATHASGGGATGSNGGGAAHQRRGDIGGTRSERVTAIKQRFPELNN